MKPMYTRQEFEDRRREWLRCLDADEELHAAALQVLAKADRHNWIHQTNWLGEPVLQLPQDMFAFQEVIHRTRPEAVVEIGTAWGGGLLFYATLMEALGGGKVIGVDTYVPDDLRQRVRAVGPLAKRISWVVGSSVEQATFKEVERRVRDASSVLVILDSHHSHEHVRRELDLYSGLIPVGNYLVCCDTVIEEIPEQTHRARPWGPGNNPRTAVREFLAERPDFEIDKELAAKLLISCNRGGYLRRISAA